MGGIMAIGRRVALGFAIVIGLNAISVFVGKTGLDSLYDGAQTATQGSVLKDRVEEARTKAGEFLRGASGLAADDVRASAASARDASAKLQSSLDGAQTGGGALDEANGALGDFSVAFDSAAKAHERQSVLLSTLQNAVSTIVGGSKEFARRQRDQLVLAVRHSQAAERAKLRGDRGERAITAYLAKFDLAAAAEVLARMTGSRGEADKAAAVLNELQALADALPGSLDKDIQPSARPLAVATHEFVQAYARLDVKDGTQTAARRTAAEALRADAVKLLGVQKDALTAIDAKVKAEMGNFHRFSRLRDASEALLRSGYELGDLVSDFSKSSAATRGVSFETVVNAAANAAATGTRLATEDRDRAQLAKIAEAIQTIRGGIEDFTVASDDRSKAIEAFSAATKRTTASVTALVDSVLERNRAARGVAIALLWGGALGALILGSLSAFLIIRSITGPLGGLTACVRRLIEHDLSVAIPGTSRADELGELARAVGVFKENAQAVQRLEAEAAAERQAAAGERRATLQRIANDLEQSLSGVIETVATAAGEIGRDARDLATRASSAAQSSDRAAGNSDVATDNVQAVAAATEELNASIGEVDRRMAEGVKMVDGASKDIHEANSVISRLSDSARRIGEIVNLISDIASRTNLLALNATIEAARAGDAGKGFAVVASEVKQLANQTAKATDEINAQVGGIQSQTTDVVSSMREIEESFAGVREMVAAGADSMREQNAATHEISKSVVNAAEGTRAVSEDISEAAEAVRGTKETAGRLLTTSDGLAQQSDALRRLMGEVVAQLRAG